MKDNLIAFFKKNIWQIVFDIVLFVGVVSVIILPQTHLYFEITHFTQIQQVVDHMQKQYEDNGNNGLKAEIKTILTK